MDDATILPFPPKPSSNGHIPPAGQPATPPPPPSPPPAAPQPTPQATQPSKKYGRRTLVSKLTDEISVGEHFAKDRGGRLYVYRGGVYRPRAEDYVARRVIDELDTATQRDLWSSRVASEVVNFIKTRAEPVEEEPGEHSINVLNGIVDIASGALHPHTPYARSTIQLPVKYDPAAQCPNLERFVGEICPPDFVQSGGPWELFASVIAPSRGIEKALFFIGPGSNGKSLLAEAILRLVGPENVCHLPLQTISGNRFAASSLFGKLANVCTDLPTSTLTDTGMFKRITSGEMIDAEEKYGHAYAFRPFARLLFSLNHFPRVAHADDAMYRRLHVVPFERYFPPNPAKRTQLIEKLTQPDEQSGAFNLALEALRRIRASGLSEPPSVRDALAEIRGVIDPVEVFLAQYCNERPLAYCAKAELLRTYNAAAARANRPAMTANAFSRHLHAIRPLLGSAQRVLAGQLEWCWLGVELRTP